MPEPLTDMERDEILKAFGARVKELRKGRGWTQKQLATALDVRFSQLNKYESGLHAPPFDKLVLLAEVLDSSIDYLVTGDPANDLPLHSTRLLDRFRALQDFDAGDREAVLTLIDAMIVKRQVEGALKPFEKKTPRVARAESGHAQVVQLWVLLFNLAVIFAAEVWLAPLLPAGWVAIHQLVRAQGWSGQAIYATVMVGCPTVAVTLFGWAGKLYVGMLEKRWHMR